MNRTAVLVLVVLAIAVVGYLIWSSSQSQDEPVADDQQTEQNNDQTSSNDDSTTSETSDNQTDNNTAENNTNESNNTTDTSNTSQNNTGNVKNPNVFIQATIGDADTLDPIHAYDTSSGEVLVNVYENLIMYDGARLDTMLPMLSTEVPTVENGLVELNEDGSMTMTFPIREGVTFQSGDPLTPEDVAYSFQRIMIHSHSDSPAWIILEDLLNVQDLGDLAEEVGDAEACQAVMDAVQVDGNNVVFSFDQPSATFLARIAHGGGWGAITNKSFVEEHGGWDGDCANWRDYYQVDKESLPLHQRSDGTGPFQLERWTADDVIVLTKNGDYWREPAYFERVELRVVPEYGTRKLQFEQGDIDVIYVDQTFTNEMEGIEGVRTAYMIPQIANTTAFFNFDISTQGNENIGSGQLDGEGIPPDFFRDLDVRKGFAFAFNYDDFVEQVYLGEANQSYGPIPSSLPFANPENPRHTFDLERAEEHFRNAWGGDLWDTGFTFTIVYNEGNNQRRIAAQIIKNNVESLNDKFNVDIRSEPWPTFLDNYRARRIPIWIIGWSVDFPDAHNFIHPYLHSQGNYGFRQRIDLLPAFEGVDEMIMQAARETDEEKRREIYYELQELAYEQAVDIFLVDPLERVWQRTWVDGWNYNPVWPGEGRYLYGVSKSPDGEMNAQIGEVFPSSVVEEWD